MLRNSKTLSESSFLIANRSASGLEKTVVCRNELSAASLLLWLFHPPSLFLPGLLELF